MELTYLIPEVVGSGISEEKQFVSPCGTYNHADLPQTAWTSKLELSSNLV